jgi:hypothetical protein
MATTSKRISQLPLYTNQQYNPAWLTCTFPANFTGFDSPEFPDTFKVPISAVMMSMRDAAFSGQLTVLKTLSAAGPVVIGESKNKSYVFIYKGTSNSTVEVPLTKPQNASSLLLMPVNTSWFFKVFVIGRSSNSTASTNIEFIGLIKRNISGTVSLVGTTTKMIHSREDLSTDASLEANDVEGEKTLNIKVKGGSLLNPYTWTARVDIVEA